MSDAPSEVPRCAGRAAVAHERTEMIVDPYHFLWVCPECGEVDALTEVGPANAAIFQCPACGCTYGSGDAAMACCIR